MDGNLQIDTVLDRLRAFQVATDLSYSALALRAGLSRAALRGMTKPDWAPTSATIRAVEALIPAGWQAGDPVPDELRDGAAAGAGDSTAIAAE